MPAIGSTDVSEVSDVSDVSDVSGTGSAADGSSPLVRPIGVSPEAGKFAGEDWYRGNKWPPADLLWAGMPPVPPWPNANPASFPDRGWAGYFLAVAVLGEFVRATTPASAGGLRWDKIALPDSRNFP